jgi:hypothetical protein
MRPSADESAVIKPLTPKPAARKAAERKVLPQSETASPTTETSAETA